MGYLLSSSFPVNLKPVPGTLQETYNVIRSAVMSRQPIAALYHGKLRLFCPHRLGRNKDGRPQVLCYQFGGQSSSGLKPHGSPDNWRCVAVEKLTHVGLTEGRWHTAENHSRPASCIVDTDVDADDFRDIDPGKSESARA